MKIAVSKRTLLCVLMLFFFLPPPLFERLMPQLEIIFDIVNVIIVVFLTFWYCMKSKWRNNAFNISYWLYIIYALIINLMQYPIALYEYISQLAFPAISAFLISAFLFDKNRNIMIKYVGMYYSILTWINAVLMVIFKHGVMYSNIGSVVPRANWLWGSKNNFVEYAPIIVLFLLLELKNMSRRQKRIRWITLVILTISIISTGSEKASLLQGSTTVFFMLLVVFFLYFFYQSKFGKRIMKSFSVGIMGIVSFIFSYIIISISIIGGKLHVFQNIFKHLGKDFTFSGRNIVWKAIFDDRSALSLWGSGAKEVIHAYTGSAYNMWIGIILKYGIIGLLLFGIIMLFCDKRNKDENDKVKICRICIFMMLLGGLMDEIWMRIVFLMILYIYHFSQIIEKSSVDSNLDEINI